MDWAQTKIGTDTGKGGTPARVPPFRSAWSGQVEAVAGIEPTYLALQVCPR